MCAHVWYFAPMVSKYFYRLWACIRRLQTRLPLPPSPFPSAMSVEELSTRRMSGSISSAETVVLPSDASPKGHERRTKDFGFLPIPKRVQYDPQRPPHFGLLMNAMFGITGSFSALS